MTAVLQNVSVHRWEILSRLFSFTFTLRYVCRWQTSMGTTSRSLHDRCLWNICWWICRRLFPSTWLSLSILTQTFDLFRWPTAVTSAKYRCVLPCVTFISVIYGPCDMANTITCCMVGSELDCCNSLLFNISTSILQALQRVQNISIVLWDLPDINK